MAESISEEERQKYLEKIKNFQEYKKEMKTIIGYFEGIKEEAHSKIGILEKKISNAIPHIEDCNGSIPCQKCGIYSMQFLERRPKEDKDLIYKCIICGGEQAD